MAAARLRKPAADHVADAKNHDVQPRLIGQEVVAAPVSRLNQVRGKQNPGGSPAKTRPPVRQRPSPHSAHRQWSRGGRGGARIHHHRGRPGGPLMNFLVRERLSTFPCPARGRSGTGGGSVVGKPAAGSPPGDEVKPWPP
jgi:hypothetical protein